MKAYFLSDMHLGAAYFNDSRERERKVVRFLESIEKDASEVYLLGDVLDYWFEYRYVVPRGFVRFFGQLARMSDAGIKITWIIGNHDIWIFDYIPNELGVEVIDGVLDRDVLGTRMVMAHGDGVWMPDRKFRIIRSIFRNKICQKLYSAIHPRWTIPFAYAWSRHSREQGTPEMAGKTGESLRRGENQILDRDNAMHAEKLMLHGEQERRERNVHALRRFCEDYSENHPEVKYFLFGHLHSLIQEPLPGGREMVVLGDWISKDSYAVFDGVDLRLEHFEA